VCFDLWEPSINLTYILFRTFITKQVTSINRLDIIFIHYYLFLDPLVQIFLALHNVVLVVQFDSRVSEYGLLIYKIIASKVNTFIQCDKLSLKFNTIGLWRWNMTHWLSPLFGLCPSSNFLTQHEFSEASFSFVFRQEKHIIWWTPYIQLFSVTETRKI
jgi:hypothetical protein